MCRNRQKIRLLLTNYILVITIHGALPYVVWENEDLYHQALVFQASQKENEIKVAMKWRRFNKSSTTNDVTCHRQ